MAKISRKTTILDAAEALFAERGFDGVSMRLIADAAPVGLGLLTHHFPSKDDLFEAVMARRVDTLNEKRRSALQALEKPTLEDLLLAFVGPYRDLIESGDPGWRAYARLIAIITQEARWTNLASRYFSDLGREMIRRIMEVTPGLSRDQATRAYVHLVAVMIGMFASTGLLDRFSEGRLDSSDISDSLPHLIQFVAGGIRALATDSGGDAPHASGLAL